MKTLVNLGTDHSLEDHLGPLRRAEDVSRLSEIAHSIYQKPLKEFSIEDLRFMISQELGLEVLVPIAADLLQENLLLEGDYYPGDLLSAVMQVPSSFWKEHQEYYWKVSEMVAGLPSAMHHLGRVIAQFEQLSGDNQQPVTAEA
jgi:hypothetical protein